MFPIVVREPQFPEKVPSVIAAQTGATMVTLPIMPGGVPSTETYIKMMDYIVQTYGRCRPKEQINPPRERVSARSMSGRAHVGIYNA